MIVAAIMLLVTYKLKQPMVLGYILADIIIGPYTPPFPLLQDIDTVNIFAELGNESWNPSLIIRRTDTQ
jgi:monovalent cation:H+ antiporter-2, CPA2 family